MNRRKSLAIVGNGLVLSLAGCIQLEEAPNPRSDGDPGVEPIASLDMIPVTDREIARRLTYPIDEVQKKFAADIIENGSKTVQGTDEPFPPMRQFVYDNKLYELTVEVIDSQPAVIFRVTLEEVDDTDTETIVYDNLPSVDKQALKEYGWDDPDVFEVGGAPFVYLEGEISESVLVPESDYPVIVWESGIQARFIVESRSETAMNKYTYRARIVHESASEYGAEIRREHEFQLPSLSEAQDRIVSEAISGENGYKILPDESIPDGFDRLAEYFSNEKKFRPKNNASEMTVSGLYFVEYNGTSYWTEFNMESRNETLDSQTV